MLSPRLLAGSDPGSKTFRQGTHRTRSPDQTLREIQTAIEAAGISRIADLTGLDHIGIPVAAAYRPHARSVSVSQGKGLTLAAAMASAAMEAIEGYHAEHICAPLRVATVQEMKAEPRVISLTKVARTDVPLDDRAKLLWLEGIELCSDETRWLPLELVSSDYTRPAVGCCGAFQMSSNGLASGNHMLEAISHGICEVIERDANSLWLTSGVSHRTSRRLRLESVDDSEVGALLSALEGAEVSVAVWETTTDVGVPSFICHLGDRRHRLAPLPYTSGSGCHPRREVALTRAITEAAQGRVTRIAGAREDLEVALYSAEETLKRNVAFERLLSEQPAGRAFDTAPTADHESLLEDVHWEIELLARAGMDEVVVVDLRRPEIGLAVVKVVIPGLEGLAEASNYAPGERASQWQRKQQAS